MKIKYTVDPDKHWLKRFLRCEIKIYTHSGKEAQKISDYITKNSKIIGLVTREDDIRQVTLAKANKEAMGDEWNVKNYGEEVIINLGEGTGWTKEIKDSYIEIDSSIILNTLK